MKKFRGRKTYALAKSLRERIFRILLGLIFFILFIQFSSFGFAQEFTATPLGDYGNITVMEVTGDYDVNTPEGETSNFPREVIAKEFFSGHKDEYDFLIFFSNFDYDLGEESPPVCSVTWTETANGIVPFT